VSSAKIDFPPWPFVSRRPVVRSNFIALCYTHDIEPIAQSRTHAQWVLDCAYPQQAHQPGHCLLAGLRAMPIDLELSACAQLSRLAVERLPGVAREFVELRTHRVQHWLTDTAQTLPDTPAINGPQLEYQRDRSLQQSIFRRGPDEHCSGEPHGSPGRGQRND